MWQEREESNPVVTVLETARQPLPINLRTYVFGQKERIRTSGHYNPNVVLYQAELLSDVSHPCYRYTHSLSGFEPLRCNNLVWKVGFEPTAIRSRSGYSDLTELRPDDAPPLRAGILNASLSGLR